MLLGSSDSIRLMWIIIWPGSKPKTNDRWPDLVLNSYLKSPIEIQLRLNQLWLNIVQPIAAPNEPSTYLESKFRLGHSFVFIWDFFYTGINTPTKNNIKIGSTCRETLLNSQRQRLEMPVNEIKEGAKIYDLNYTPSFINIYIK